MSFSNKNISDFSGTLKTLKTEDSPEHASMNAAIDYILSVQNEDGGWGQSNDGNSSVHVTATVVMLLKQFTVTPRLTASMNKATNYLITKQVNGGTYGSGPLSLLETVLTYNALVGNTKNSVFLNKTRSYLLSMQRPDGSWNDDPQLTVLAIRALYCADSDEQPPDTTNQDSYRRNSDTEYHDDKQVQTTETDSSPDDQREVVYDVGEDHGTTPVVQEDKESKAEVKSENRKKDFKGKVSLAIRRKGGYVTDEPETDAADRSLSATRRAETAVSSTKATGSITGKVVDGVTKAMISDASVSVAGNPPIVTDGQGTFVINDVPDTYRITVFKEGYREQSYQGNVTAGETMDMLIYLMPECMDEDAAAETEKISNREPFDVVTYESASVKTVVCDSSHPDIPQIERQQTSRIRPDMLIEIDESLFPSTVIPDGDKQVKVTIRLEGVQVVTDPVVLSAVTSPAGDKINIFFDKTMATPLGKHGQFSISASDNNIPITAATLNGHDNTRIDLTLGSPVTSGQTILMSYSAGDILSSDGKGLMSFTDFEVTNQVLLPIYSQDGFGYSGQIIQNPLGNTIFMTGYSQWPSGFYKNVLAFISGVFDGQYIWMIPANADSVIRVDKDTGAMKEYNAWPADFKKGGHAFAGGVFDGQKIWLVPYYADRVIAIDKDTGVMEWFHKRPSEFGNVEYAFTGGVFDGEGIWLIPLNADSVIRIDRNTGRETKYNQWPSGFSKGVNAFTGGVFDGENIWMVPSSADKIIKLSSFSPMSVSANITANEAFSFYISQDESTEGDLIGHGSNWSSVYSFNAALVPGVTNYLHIKSTDTSGPIAAFIGDFLLNDQKFRFKNGTQRLLTGEDCWTVYTDAFGGTQDNLTIVCKNGMGKWQTRFGIDLNAQWIWTGNGKDFSTRYFSTPIYYSTLSADPVSNVRVINTIPDATIEIYKDSFTKQPYSLLSEKGKTIVEWRFEKIAAGQVENVSFNVMLKDPVRGEDRSISDRLELLYEDVEKRCVRTELGPCCIHVLDSDIDYSIQTEEESDTLQADVSYPDSTVLEIENHHQYDATGDITEDKNIVEGREDYAVSSKKVKKFEKDSNNMEILDNLIGSITAQPNPVYQGLAVTISYNVSNNANMDLRDLTVNILIVNSDSKEIKKTFEAPVKARKGATIAGSFILSTSIFEPHTYTALLQVSQFKQGTPEIIAETNFEVRVINVIVT